jgi:hypothetical protein
LRGHALVDVGLSASAKYHFGKQELVCWKVPIGFPKACRYLA